MPTRSLTLLSVSALAILAVVFLTATLASHRSVSAKCSPSSALSIAYAGANHAAAPESAAVALSFQSPKSTFCVGETVTLTLVVNSPDQAMNTAAGTVTYDPEKLQLVGVDQTGSLVSLWIIAPSASSTEPGTVPFAGIAFHPGFIGNQGTIFTLSFKVMDAGQTTIGIANPQVLADDGAGTDLLATGIPSSLTLTPPALVGDLNGDGKVTMADLSILLSNYGKPSSTLDFDGSGVVDIKDVSILIGEMSK